MPESTDFAFPPVQGLLRELGIWLDKHKSQHFLRSHGVCAEIATLCYLTHEHAVVEIGAGLGNLTVELARRAGSVVAVELDEAFANWHQFLAANHPNVRFVREDFLKTDLGTLFAGTPPGPRVAAGNLPYQITSPVLFKLCDSNIRWDRIVVMVQAEVADRIAAGPATREAGVLTYKLAALYEARIAMRLGPEEFLPPPKVHSAILILEPRENPVLADPILRRRTFELITAAFQQRRKTLLNSLLGSLAETREGVILKLAEAGIDSKRRPETLTVEEFATLGRLTLGE